MTLWRRSTRCVSAFVFVFEVVVGGGSCTAVCLLRLAVVYGAIYGMCGGGG